MKTETLERPKTTSLDALPAYARPYFNISPGMYNGNRKSGETALAQLPFIGLDRLQRHRAPTTTLTGINLPVERIISSQRPFENWAARGSFKRTQDDRLTSSLERAEYFIRTQGHKNPDSRVIVEIFEDNAGELWGTVIDGTHRVMAAKALGEELIQAELRLPIDPALVDRYDGDVLAEATAAR